MEKTIYLAGGCFWGTERAMQLLDGVVSTTVGYANGHTDNPTYKEVCTDTTGYRETVKVVYDSRKISMRKIVDAFFICIDPTQKDRQKEDVGTQYQTGVYYDNEADLPLLKKIFAEKRRNYEEFYVELKPLERFFDAEEYHQDYLIKNPQGYCHVSPEEFEEVRKLNQEKDRPRVYFAGSIRGGRQDADLYRQMITHLLKSADVLTEHVGNLDLEVRPTPQEIYQQDMYWLSESDLLIGEVSTPSLGVGYELAYGEKIGVPCHLFCRRSISLSAMLTGDPYFRIYYYEEPEEVLRKIDEILKKY
ncbi:MAG: peptide-methionine (S)-S-oxide reductase MsrA [Erysipelotrichaceae bacterium]|nr:peptide-methionine (S)-S-oxide reductase MsrA [Erysipelotrichaceae bacterium]